MHFYSQLYIIFISRNIWLVTQPILSLQSPYISGVVKELYQMIVYLGEIEQYANYDYLFYVF